MVTGSLACFIDETSLFLQGLKDLAFDSFCLFCPSHEMLMNLALPLLFCLKSVLDKLAWVAGLYIVLNLVLGLLVSKEASYTDLGWKEFCLHRVAITTLTIVIRFWHLFCVECLCPDSWPMGNFVMRCHSHIILSSACLHSHVFIRACYCALTTISNTSWVLLDFWMDSIASVFN